MKITDFDLGRKVYTKTAKQFPQLGLSDTDQAYAHVIRRHGPELEKRGIARRVGSGHGTILLNEKKFPDTLFELMSRGVNPPEEAA